MQTVTQKTLEDTMYYGDIPVFVYKINYPSFTTTCDETAGRAINGQWIRRNIAGISYLRRQQRIKGIIKMGCHSTAIPWRWSIKLLIMPGALPVYIRIPIPIWEGRMARQSGHPTHGTL